MGPAERDRAIGALVGLAAGDALGAGYEFDPKPPQDIDMIGGGTFGWARGEWTDDTQMAICVAEVAATGNLEPAEVGDRFLAWYRSGPKDVGNQTRAVLGRARIGAELSAVADDHFARHPGRSAGNGSLMRTAAVAIAHLGDDDAIAAAARSISGLTHADPRAGHACVLWCVAIDRAVREHRLDGVFDGLALLDAEARKQWEPILHAATTEASDTFSENGFVVTALQAALAAVLQTRIPENQPCRHLAEALRAAVRIGNDTDTVAAIAGSLLGACWGASAVPLVWRRLLHGWPGYRHRDLVRLAFLTAEGGRVDPYAWPLAADLAPYYESQWPARPVAVALPDDPGVMIGNVAALGQVDADVVVSLCRIGSGEVRDPAVGLEVWLIDDSAPEANPNLDFVLEDTAEAIAAWREAGESVFLHCARAESRTPFVAAAYLARRLGVSGRAGLERVRDVLPGAQPNAAFLRALDGLSPKGDGREHGVPD